MTPKQQITYHIASISVIPPYFLRSCSVSINFAPLPDVGNRSGLNLSKYHRRITYMGIYKTSSIGVRRKSVGEVTYKSVRGRVIASAKIVENTSKTTAQTEQRSAFGIMGKMGKLLANWINQTFDKTKYGSQRNHFVKVNAPVMLWLKENKKLSTVNYLSQISAALDDGVPVFAGYGTNFVESEFEQTDKELSVSLTFSKKFVVGDIIKILVAQSYSKKTPGNDGLSLVSHFSSYDVYDYVVTDAEVGNNILSLDKAKVPGLATACEPLSSYTQSAIMASVAVLSGKETCQCYFSPLELYVNAGGGDRPEIE